MAEKTVYEKSLELHEKHHGKVEVISKVKVENKADLDLSNNLGETPLMVAQDNKYKEIEEYLLSMGAGYNGNNFRTL